MHIIHWLMDFIGVNNSFSTHMYNFWSGFGGNISVLALIGTVFGVYRHNLARLESLRHFEALKLEKLESLNPLQFGHKKDKDNREDK